MKVAVIGATGTIGKAVANLLKDEGHEVVESSRKIEPRINIDKPDSIDSFYDTVGALDAVICAAGNASFGPIQRLSRRQIEIGLNSKLMGQIELVRKGMDKMNDGGTFILTSGMLSIEPWPDTSAVAMVNAAIEGFTRAAALDLNNNQRICTVSPPLIKETAARMGRDTAPWPDAANVATAYLEALESADNGVIRYVEGFEPK